MPTSKISENPNVTDEKARIVKLVEGHRFPSGICGFDVEFGEDSTGEPAVWIWFEIEEKFEADAATQKQINELAKSVSQRLLQENTLRWPYVRFRERA